MPELKFEQLKSEQDVSVNFVSKLNKVQILEARYVRRVKEYFIAYLSSQTGCTHNCKMCYLTQSGQNKQVIDSTLNQLIDQAEEVLIYYDSLNDPAERVNFNWMSRGEPLANKYMWENNLEIIGTLHSLASMRGLKSNFNISTILPKSVEELSLTSLSDNLSFYYSLYSIDPSFRKRWLPKAMHPDYALHKLKEYQLKTGREIILHWAFIEGENDSLNSVRYLADYLRGWNLKARFNCVRYNPHPKSSNKESSTYILERNFNMIAVALGSNDSQIVDRVGFDVNASCGMFI